MLIGPLNPNATYTVVVEARKMQQYSEVHGGEIKNGVGKIEDEADSDFEDTCSTFILTAQSDHLTIHTAQPPDPPRNLGILATTCNSIKIGWDPPKEHGVEVLGIRVDCSPKKPEEGKHQSFELIPDARSLVIENLTELTSYLVVVTAITEEYFDQLPERHQYKKMHRIPRDVAIELNESPWLPNTSIVAITSGTEAPYNIRVKRSTGTSIVIGWQAPVVHGTNRLQGIMVRWCEARLIRNKEDETALVSHINLMPEETEVTIEDLMIGMEYKITVEAVVSVRTIIDLQRGDHENRRTAHIVGKPLWARTKAPCEPPKLYITGYSTSTIQLYWEKPVLFTVLGKEEEDKRYLKRCLEGYKLEINGKLHMRLGPAAQSVTLTKCKYAKTYSVVLVAMTCTEEVKKERVKRIQLASSSSFTSSQPFDDHDLDESASEAVEVRVPRLQEGNIANISAFYNHKSSNRDGVMGDITLTWDVQGNWSRTKQFDILWHCHEDGVVHRKCVESDVRKCTIPVVRNKCTYEISMEPRFGNDAMPVTLTKLQVLIPGPPDAPTIWTKHVGKEEFSMEWGEPRLYGGVKVKGYQVYMNDRKVGNELSSSHRKAIIPCKPNRHYKINLKAISADMDFGDSALSNTLFISTSLSQGGQILADAHDENMADLSDQGSVDGDQELIVRVAKVTHTSIHLDWFTYSPPEGIACYKMQWTSVAQPTQREFKLSPQESSCILQKCYPGTNHFIRLVALGADGRILEKSKQVVVQTSAPPEAPVVSLRACNFNYTAIQWEKPTTFGVANITGYKVYVNGVVEAVVGPDQYHYCYTKGQGCKEYVYQVKALTADDQLCSKPSEPFVVTWPGMKTPLLQRVPTVSSNSIKVMWEEPYVTEGVKIKNYRVYLEDESSGMTVQTIFPIHPDVREAEFHNLKQGIYLVYLEILVYNSNTVFRADPIRVQPRIAPDPPQITVTVAGLEERRQIERVTCELLNKRDKLLRNLNNPTLMGAASVFRKKDSGEVSSRTSENLQHVESMLVDCFSSINHYTGHLMAHVSWQCPQSDPDMVVSGYKVLVDGKQYGSTLHSGMRTVRIKLSMEKTSHRVSMVAITNQPYASSLESNVVELLTEPFRQFTFYCFHNVHSKGSLWPNSGACQYEDTYAAERRLPGRRLVNQGLLKRRVPPPSCNVIDIFTGDIKSLLPPGGPNGPTAILFWTKWCLTSQRIMAHYVKFARENSKSYDFISVACNSGDRDGTVDELIHLLTNNSWRDDSHIWHCTSLKQKTGVVETSQTSHSPNLTRTGSGKKSKKGTLPISSDTREDSQQQEDVASLYGVIGVPTLVIIHPEDYIAWQGRFCAFEYESFENGMHHTFSEALGEACTVPGCELCKQDFYMKVDTPPTAADAYHYTKPKPGKVASAVVANEKDSSGVPLITTPAIGATVTPKTESSFGGGSRPYSAGRPGSATRRPELSPFKQPASLAGKLFMKAGKAGKHDNRISVSQRPFSASKTRPGSAKRMGSAK
ncbi:uncharacterized protein LOC106180596 isoform X1 [Lingula anatina]|uniref:Uncharacterized protein LOC106180596 isoform X1 n=1 Tax=Lingula anatina TaxID=7574 RepID=A0A2R2MT49_LINAN|nr:uncharacterized protein LOC106180596 isoform X1 [Lingula anatina]|eukprot:XP_023933288.1 uncharacterized protein LOC106180596 isoform X1 [Lingula anatina]